MGKKNIFWILILIFIIGNNKDYANSAEKNIQNEGLVKEEKYEINIINDGKNNDTKYMSRGLDLAGAYDKLPNYNKVLEDGFKFIPMSDWPSDERTKLIREKFVEPLAVKENSKEIGLIDWGLVDLEGNGSNTLFIIPNLMDKKNTFQIFDESVRILIYRYDKKNDIWIKALDDYARAVAWKSLEYEGMKEIQLALMTTDGYKTYRIDGLEIVRIK